MELNMKNKNLKASFHNLLWRFNLPYDPVCFRNNAGSIQRLKDTWPQDTSQIKFPYIFLLTTAKSSGAHSLRNAELALTGQRWTQRI